MGYSYEIWSTRKIRMMKLFYEKTTARVLRDSSLTESINKTRLHFTYVFYHHYYYYDIDWIIKINSKTKTGIV